MTTNYKLLTTIAIVLAFGAGFVVGSIVSDDEDSTTTVEQSEMESSTPANANDSTQTEQNQPETNGESSDSTSQDDQSDTPATNEPEPPSNSQEGSQKFDNAP